MTFTYSSTDLSTDLAKVRRIIGDTDSTDPLLTDEEIAYYLTVDDNVFGAAALCAKAIQATFARLADTTIESVSVKYSQRAKQYASLAEDLEKQAAANDLVSPSVLGISKDAMQTQREDDDRVPNKFEVDQFSNPPGLSETNDIIGAD